MTMLASRTTARTPRPVRIHDGSLAYEDPSPPTFDCFLSHFDTLADAYERLAAECRKVRADMANTIAAGGHLTKRQIALARRISLQIDSSDVRNHADPPPALVQVGEAAEDVYFDIDRLSGRLVWHEPGHCWEDAEQLAHRRAEKLAASGGAQ